MKKAILYVVLALIVLTSGQGGYTLSGLDVSVAPYRWGLVEWEVGHFFNKWRYRVRQALPWHLPPAAEETILQDYFHLNQKIRHMETVVFQGRIEGYGPEIESNMPMETMKEIKKRRANMRPQAEERLEAEISSILAAEGFQSRIGMIWPPVDIELVNPPSVLVLSPRDKIERRGDITLRPGLGIEDLDALERRILEEEDLSALVVSIGGIATYPSIVSADHGLSHALQVAAHEWLHQYWWFRPLGRNYSRDTSTTTLNESAANLAGKELGQLVYSKVTGTSIGRSQKDRNSSDQSDHGFNFAKEMRETRTEVDALLLDGAVEKAEEYMETKRQVFVDNGYYVRKLNQAYFAFHGTYASNPASISPIHLELSRFRLLQESLGDFITEIAKFGSYEEFRKRLLSLEQDKSVSG